MTTVNGGENTRLSWTVSRILQFPLWVPSRMALPHPFEYRQSHAKG